MPKISFLDGPDADVEQSISRKKKFDEAEKQRRELEESREAIVKNLAENLTLQHRQQHRTVEQRQDILFTDSRYSFFSDKLLEMMPRLRGLTVQKCCLHGKDSNTIKDADLPNHHWIAPASPVDQNLLFVTFVVCHQVPPARCGLRLLPDQTIMMRIDIGALPTLIELLNLMWF
jgi:hypothetical protein